MRKGIPALSESLEDVLAAFTPDVLVDARMRKHDTPEPQRGLAPLTIGLGPNCEAGETTDVAVETASGHELGHVLWTRRARDLEGEPQEIDGHVRDRYVYAPCSGPFATGHEIGEVVRQGEIVGTVRSASVRAPLSGRLRGLTHAGADVEVSTKIVEVEPRGDMRFVMGLVAAAGGNRRRRSENRSRTLQHGRMNRPHWQRAELGATMGATCFYLLACSL